jgi:hypothetical protein
LFAVLLGVGAVVRFGGVLLKVSQQGLGQGTPGLAGAIWGLTHGSDTIARAMDCNRICPTGAGAPGSQPHLVPWIDLVLAL